jgi:hypothetical protein
MILTEQQAARDAQLEAHARPDLAPFGPVVAALEELAQRVLTGQISPHDASVTASLDGLPARELLRTVPGEDRRLGGLFFTPPSLRERAASSANLRLDVIDPACGAGDLLLAAARKLPVGKTAPETLTLWRKRLLGRDLEELLVRVATARLAMLACVRSPRVFRGAADHDLPLSSLFPGLQVGDAFESLDWLQTPVTFLVNPPFGVTQAPPDCDWAHGGVSRAGLFVDRLLRIAPQDSSIIAILPDVLRSGARYWRWRESVERSSRLDSVEVVGRFDVSADVDVFLLRCTARGSGYSTAAWWPRAGAGTSTVGDRFEVAVGPVVPHRHPQKGPWHPFVSPRLIGKAQVIDTFQHRRFRGRLFNPPLVVIRRTSKAGLGGHRILATLVLGDRPVAVENHLIVCLPKQRTQTACEELVAVLSRPGAAAHLNARIRCRHLTVDSIKELPWKP